jgi:hypothetical protein
MTDSRAVLNVIGATRKWRIPVCFLVLLGACRVDTQAPAEPPDGLPAPLVYWSMDRGVLVRADPGDSALRELELPYDEGGAGVPDNEADRRCRKCHVFGGGRLAFTYFGIGGPGGVTSWPDGAVVVDNGDGSVDAQAPWSFPALSSSGDFVVGGDGLRLSVWDAATGDKLHHDVAQRPATQAALSAYGDTLVFVADPTREGAPADDPGEFDRGDLFAARLDLGDGRIHDVRRLVSGDGQSISYPALSPDGRFAVYTRAPWSQSARGEELTEGTLELVDLDDGRVRTLLRAAPRRRAWMPSLVGDVDELTLAFISREDGEPRVRLARVLPGALGDPSSPAIALPDALSEPGFFPRFAPP